MDDKPPKPPSPPSPPLGDPSPFGDPVRVPMPSRTSAEVRKQEIEDIIDQMHAALIHVRREWRFHGETAALVHFVHTLLIATTALDSMIESVKAKVDPATLTDVELEAVRISRRLEVFRKDATSLIDDLRNLVHRLPEGEGGGGT